MTGTDRAGGGGPGGQGGAGEPGGRPLLLGVRHHGPGSARAVRAALEATRPGVVLIEGPPEADALIPLAADEDMRPPVALLAHAVDEPGRSAFWPLAEFSPEWVAVRWALEHDVPARFIDLPAAHTLAWRAADGHGDVDADARGDDQAPPGRPGTAPADVRRDPLAALAAAAGHDDPERWWEDVIEHRGRGAGDALAPFTALEEAMTALRETEEDGEAEGGEDREGVTVTYGTSCGRPTCGSRSGRRDGSSPKAWPWSAGRGTCPRCAAGPPSPPTGPC